MKGYKFRRQHPISEFVADFYCHTLKLVVEVDGGIHKLNGKKEYDIKRTDEMNRFGITVIRFTNRQIIDEMENVLKELAVFLTPVDP